MFKKACGCKSHIPLKLKTKSQHKEVQSYLVKSIQIKLQFTGKSRKNSEVGLIFDKKNTDI